MGTTLGHRFIKLRTLFTSCGKIVIYHVIEGESHYLPVFKQMHSKIPHGKRHAMSDATYDAYKSHYDP